MSTLIFLKSHGKHKKGEKATVPFQTANDLVAQNIAVRWDGGLGEQRAKEIFDAERQPRRQKPEPVKEPDPTKAPDPMPAAPTPRLEPPSGQSQSPSSDEKKDQKP